MSEPTRIHHRLAPYIDEALKDGFAVYANPTGDGTIFHTAGHVYLYLEEGGPCALLQVPTFEHFDPISVTAPIIPSKAYGSGVIVDHDDTIEGVIFALRKTCSSPTVTVRFVAKRGEQAPVVPNAGAKAMHRPEQMVKLEPGRANWTVKVQAGRLEVGDRFESKLEDGRDFGILTVKAKRYGGPDYTIAFITTEELPHVVEIPVDTFVTLAGAA